MNMIKRIILKIRIRKAWRKRIEEYYRVKSMVFAAKSANSPNEVACLTNATAWAEYWMVQHHGTHWCEKTIMR